MFCHLRWAQTINTVITIALAVCFCHVSPPAHSGICGEQKEQEIRLMSLGHIRPPLSSLPFALINCNLAFLLRLHLHSSSSSSASPFSSALIPSDSLSISLFVKPHSRLYAPIVIHLRSPSPSHAAFLSRRLESFISERAGEWCACTISDSGRRLQGENQSWCQREKSWKNIESFLLIGS